MGKKILVLVEGEKKDVRLMERLFDVYLAEFHKEIVSYKTNIYELYGQLFKDHDEDDIDLLQLLKSREPDKQKKAIFDVRYTEIFLIFDFDAQDALYDDQKLYRLMKFFSDSTVNGRLYINYPMVESFCHIHGWDEDYETYNFRSVPKSILMNGTYKKIVQNESCCSDIRKYGKVEFNKIIDLNLAKISYLLYGDIRTPYMCDSSMLREILKLECQTWNEKQSVDVLNTCILYFYEYYPNLIGLLHEGVKT